MSYRNIAFLGLAILATVFALGWCFDQDAPRPRGYFPEPDASVAETPKGIAYAEAARKAQAAADQAADAYERLMVAKRRQAAQR